MADVVISMPRAGPVMREPQEQNKKGEEKIATSANKSKIGNDEYPNNYYVQIDKSDSP